MLCFEQPRKENMKKKSPIFHYIVNPAVKYKYFRKISSRIRLWDVFLFRMGKTVLFVQYRRQCHHKKRTLTGASSTSSFLSSQVVSNQVLSTYECLTTVFGMGTGGTTQLSPLDFVKVCTAVNVSQSHCAFSLRSWDVFAYDLLPNRLRLLDRSAYPQNYTEDSMEHFRGEMYACLTLLPALRQSAAVNVSQSPARFALGSWDVFAR